ncbi:hypothetical protein B0T26DRAFT_755117 [Lasiosphaeria miniovina]|uniref:Uncharacterized protein n=1 Tax=Lasiosphaeria miniovina TaxID=1954250 RepID=A0AA40A695_9PEZI|nr:uncharacterized protein B0T26DRAFT_755117 [Lasiosphaeria miniovina]KAK0709995.1 hypothetical protein B0T26DRAFT_755117 [Lasiosphaeria miniovina]
MHPCITDIHPAFPASTCSIVMCELSFVVGCGLAALWGLDVRLDVLFPLISSDLDRWVIVPVAILGLRS